MKPAEDTILIVFSQHNSVDELARMSGEVKILVVARWLDYHAEDRALMHENKTVVYA